MNKNAEKIIFDYFKYWEDKNIDGLDSLLDDNIYLKDWDNSIRGIDNVRKLNNDFFNNVENIDLNIQSFSVTNNTGFAHLKIKIDNNEIEVVDKIMIGSSGKITSIQAFKC